MTVNPAANRPDGTDADHFVDEVSRPGCDRGDRCSGWAGCWCCCIREELDRSGLRLGSVAYQPGRSNSNDELLQHLSSVLNDFSLTATIGWSRANAIADQTNSTELIALTA